MGMGNSKTIVEATMKGSGSHNQINLGESVLQAKNGTAIQDVMSTASKTASKVLESGGSIVAAPAVWLKDIQQNWLSYMLVAAVILSVLAFFYCSFCFYFNRAKKSSSDSSLIELAKIISHKTGVLQQQLPCSVLNLPPPSSKASPLPNIPSSSNTPAESSR